MRPQFEIVILIMEVLVPTGIWILTVHAYNLPIDRKAVLTECNHREMERM